jgi:outer membrane protein insertion porin family
MILNTEFIVPLVEDIKLKGVVFFDYGRAFDKDEEIELNELRKTAGVGLRWMSPLGPIRLEWGFNLYPEDDENNDKIEFSLGGFF